MTGSVEMRPRAIQKWHELAEARDATGLDALLAVGGNLAVRVLEALPSAATVADNRATE